MVTRKLDTNERQTIAEMRRIKEVAAHPRKMIAVRVNGETNENGEPVVTVRYVGERRPKCDR
ncbi:hypothetical protein ACO2I3_06280 [Leptospira interrogans]